MPLFCLTAAVVTAVMTTAVIAATMVAATTMGATLMGATMATAAMMAVLTPYAIMQKVAYRRIKQSYDYRDKEKFDKRKRNVEKQN